jgi:hypothetical protein
MDNMLPWLKANRVFVDKNDNPFNRPDKKKSVPVVKKPINKPSLELEL